jgi:hypothetical protein
MFVQKEKWEQKAALRNVEKLSNFYVNLKIEYLYKFEIFISFV